MAFDVFGFEGNLGCKVVRDMMLACMHYSTLTPSWVLLYADITSEIDRPKHIPSLI